MQCKHHPDRKAAHICVNCSAPICKSCAEKIKSGVYCCFQCAMLQFVSDGGSDVSARHQKASAKRKKGKRWGAFQYFVILSSVLILVMWSVILFGGQAGPQRTAGFSKKGRVLLFMVDGALRRYAHYEGPGYPAMLADLIPKYLALKESELFHLDKLVYDTNEEAGYRLSLASTEEGGMHLILSPKGIEHTAIVGRGV